MKFLSLDINIYIIKINLLMENLDPKEFVLADRFKFVK